MSDTEDSITWSNSEESYFSSDSSSEQCLRPGRLMDLIAEKFRLMKCINREQQQPATTALQVVMSDQAEERSKNLHPQRLASLLKEKLERLHVSREDEENLAERSPQRVTFRDQSSSSISTSNQIVALMDVDVQVQSTSGAPPSSSSTNSAQEMIQEGNLVDMMVTEQEKSILVLNFPDNVFVDENETSQPKVGECASAETAVKREVKLYDTGRITVSFGEREFETVTVAGELQHDEELVQIEQDATTQRITMRSLGVVQHFLDVLPPMTEDIVNISVDENMDQAK